MSPLDLAIADLASRPFVRPLRPPANYRATEPPTTIQGLPVFIDGRQSTIRPDGTARGLDGRPFDA